MDASNLRLFIEKTESLVKPQDVTAISFLGDFNRFFPVGLQTRIMRKGSASIPYMGFIVDPFCTFLAYAIRDVPAAQALLPPGYDLVPTALFEGEPQVPLLIAGAFSVRTSAFIGNRIEFYLIARHRDSGLLSWIIADYETNTNNYEPKNGFGGYTADPAMFTITPGGEVWVDFKGKKSGKSLKFSAPLNGLTGRKLRQDLWVEGNLSVDYGGELHAPTSTPFSLIFDPALMAQAQEIPISTVTLEKNTYLAGLYDAGKPISAAVFPHSQHFIIRQDLPYPSLRNGQDLEEQIRIFLSRESFPTMTGDAIKKPILRGMLLSALITYGVIGFLLVKLWWR